MTTEQLIPSQRTVPATLKNQSRNQIFCERYFNWSNSPGPFPPAIPYDGVVDFKTFGPRGAVLYNGLGAAGKPIGWALAWTANPIGPGGPVYKVYVTCGTKSYIDNLTEKEIQECLAKSGAESNATDLASKTTVKATIEIANSPNQPEIASLVVDFGVIA